MAVSCGSPIAYPCLLGLSPRTSPSLSGQYPGDTACSPTRFHVPLILFTPRLCLCLCVLCFPRFNICESTLEHISKVLACQSFHLQAKTLAFPLRPNQLSKTTAHNTRPF